MEYDMKQCPKCNAEHEKPGIFCSRKCANSRTWSDEAKKQKGTTLKKFIQDNPMWHERRIATDEARLETLKKTLFAKNHARFLDGTIAARVSIKRWLIETCGEVCSICNMQPEWHGKFLSLQVDHINGINNDNRSENLRLVCPNCHSQTDTFAGKKHRKNKLVP